MATIDLSRFHRTFFEESFEGLDAMEAALLALDPARTDAETINGVGNRKNEELLRRIREDGVEVFDGSRRYLEAARQAETGPIRRTIVFMYGRTVPGQDMYLRGGIDHAYSQNVLHKPCADTAGYDNPCAIPQRHRLRWDRTDYMNDFFLDWYGAERGQGPAAAGSPMIWTTNDPANPKASLWNPAGAAFEAACDFAGVRSGTVAIIGGPGVFGMFMDRYETFWLSQAHRVRLPGGEPCFPGVPDHSPQQILAAHGLMAGKTQILDPANDVTVTPWHRAKRVAVG